MSMITLTMVLLVTCVAVGSEVPNLTETDSELLPPSAIMVENTAGVAVNPSSETSSLSLEETGYGDPDANFPVQLWHHGSFNVSSQVTDGRGIDVVSVSGNATVGIIDNSDNRIEAYNISSGTYLGYWGLASGNTNPYGWCWVSEFHVNDVTSTNMFAGSGSSWTTYTNPCSNDGLGMDYDYFYTSRIFESYFTKTIKHFSPFSTSSISYNASSYVGGSYILGLGVCPLWYNTGVVVSSYNSNKLYFFIRHNDTTNWEYCGSQTIPIGDVDQILGIAHDYSTGFMVVLTTNTSGEYWITRIGFDVSLEQDTWGGIKASF